MIKRAWLAFVWWLDIGDASGDTSLAKLLALAAGVCVIHDCWQRGFTAANVSALALVISAAFGRSVFMHWLTRASISLSSQSSHTTSHSIIERRDAAMGVDPA